MKISVSFIKSKYNEKETIKLIDKTDADYLHVDIMDGKFVEQKNYSFKEIKRLVKYSTKKLDVHLMCENPSKYIKDYALLNTQYLTFHFEAVKNPNEIINEIHSYGIKCGISIKPSTLVESLKPYINNIEQVLVMSVEPGKGGQEFMSDIAFKIDQLQEMNSNFIVSVDGGINNETINHVKNADMVVSGSYVCLSDNYQEKIDNLRN
ncbi:MAG: ribulose-phosphate 3-epimerase [Bacilli bacterium]|nr:ribulose-phosphate 3-epimerase [Bacilli bacterium]